MKKLLLSFITLFFFHSFVLSQNKAVINIPDYNNYYEVCGYCMERLDEKPPEVMMTVEIDKKGNILFMITSAKWFWGFMQKSQLDAIAADVVLKSSYACSSNENNRNFKKTNSKLLKSISISELKERSSTYGDNLTINLGALPNGIGKNDCEVNLLFLKNKYLCHYHTFVNIESRKWEMLDMGMYADTITYKSKIDTNAEFKRVKTYNKQLKFIVPFEKSKTVYSPEDIKPLYDSLELNDFIITKISIRAYASVEGSTEINNKLQQGRAESIVEALQSFQSENIEQEITTSENWMEFFQDIQNTEFAYLVDKSKQEIKRLLRNKAFEEKLEPILMKQRKAVVQIDFETRFKLMEATAEEIKDEFFEALITSNTKRGNSILKYSFSRVAKGTLNNDFLSGIEIPEQKETAVLANSKDVYQFFLDNKDLKTTYEHVKSLRLLDPNSKEIAYNYTVLRFYLWLNGDEDIDHREFKLEIINLMSMGIPKPLVYRMLANYYIIITEMYMVEGDYDNKDRCLDIIYQKYKSADPTPSDLLSLAQYFVSYSKFDWAEEILAPYIVRVDVDEDLLFYYINLTITEPSVTENKEYNRILLNAIDINKERFCKMFNSLYDGGVSFQLLEDFNLKMNYCQSCQ
jgi:outer membrane protein OmpA-like peptidoglycan-associated protein